MSKQAKDLQVVDQARELTTTNAPINELEGFSFDDYMTPRILMMAGTSQDVTDQKFKIGDVINSMTMKKLTGFDLSPLEVVPIKAFKSNRLEEDGTGDLLKVEHGAEQIRNAQIREGVLEDGPRKGTKYKRYLCYNFYVIPMHDLVENMVMPAHIIFKSTSAPAGRNLNSQILVMNSNGRNMFTRSFLISSVRSNTGKYGVFECTQGNEVSPEHQAIAALWKTRIGDKILTTDAPRESSVEKYPPAAPATVAAEKDLY